MRARAGQEGFTLVELMVVVLIVGILVAIAIPMYSAAQGSARLKTCLSNQRLIEGAVAIYRSSGAPLWTQAHHLNGNNTPNTVDVLVPTYIRSGPRCPVSGTWYWVDAAGNVTGDRDGPGFVAGHYAY